MPGEIMPITKNLAQMTLDDKSIIIGLCGRARAGKSTFSNKLVRELQSLGISSVHYSADWRFHHASRAREQWLRNSYNKDTEAYIESVNQQKWWDFPSIYQDLFLLKTGKAVVINDVYDRHTGEKSKSITVSPAKVIIYESAILGDESIMSLLNQIIFLHLPEWRCLELAIKTDRLRRNAANIASRFLLTTHCENQHYSHLFSNYKNNILVINRRGKILTGVPEIFHCPYFPIPMKGCEANQDRISIIQ